MLEPQLLVACQQHCCRALFLHDGPRAARTTMRNALAVSRTLLAVFAPRVLRVSAAARRGAAAYADGDQRMVRARTHQSGLVRPPQSEIRWAFLHNFLRTCRWHRVSSDSHTYMSCRCIPPFRARSGTIIPVGYTATSPPRGLGWAGRVVFGRGRVGHMGLVGTIMRVAGARVCAVVGAEAGWRSALAKTLFRSQLFSFLE